MSDKRKKIKAAEKREQRRLKQIGAEERVSSDVELPLGAVPADLSEQVPNGSYSPPPEFYVDKDFTCRDCGRQEVWTAQQQKWYYEVVKVSLYAKAVRCRDCRRKHSEMNNGQGDPNPIKHSGSLMKTIRGKIEPSLLETGFEFVGKYYGSVLRSAWIDYSRPNLTLRCKIDPHEAWLIAETMDDKAECEVIANVRVHVGSRSTFILLDRVDEFVATVRAFVQTLPAVTDASDSGNS